MKQRTAVIGIGLIAVGLTLNFLDAYYSGNLPFSPATSDQNNSVSKLNRLGQPVSSTKILLGSLLAVTGAVTILVKWFAGKRR